MEATEEIQLKLAEEARKEYEAEQTDEPKAEPQPKEVEPAKEEAEPVEATETEEKKEEVKEEPKAETEKKDVDDEAVVNEWAIKNGMTTEEAKEDLAKTKAIIEKYKSPEEIAKALRSTQSAYDKLRTEAKQEKEAEVFKPSANPKLEVMTFVDANKDKLIENYRNNYPARTRDMEDDAILEEVSDKLLGEFNNWQSSQVKVVQQQAAQKREQLLAGLSEGARRFLPDIKAVLDKTADHVLISKGFNLQDIERWAKGSKYDADIKDAEERGYKRAMEQSRIVGVVPTASVASKPKVASTGISLGEYDKRRAKEMFGTTNMTEDEMYKEYAGLVKKNKK